MKPLAAILIGGLSWLGYAGSAEAQVAYVTYYQPMTVYSAPVVAPAPVVQTAYYAPAPAVALAPAPALTYQPVAQVRTRYRPILGGTVSRVRYGYTPVVYQPAPVVLAY